MTQKELQKLRRQDLLELLLAQGEESERMAAELEECRRNLKTLETTYERVRKRLDVKDAIIHELKELLEAERTQRQIKLEDAGSIAEASLRLNGIFEAAQEAADQYLYNIKLIGKKQAELTDQEAEWTGQKTRLTDQEAELTGREAEPADQEAEPADQEAVLTGQKAEPVEE